MPVNGLNEGVTLQQVMQAVYNSMSDNFKDRIEGTFATDEDLQNFGKALNEYKADANEFLYSLINQIAMIRINYNNFKSPLSMFKKGMLEFGDTVEDVYIEPIKGMLYEAEVPNTNPGDQWKTFKPDVDVVFYKENKELVYPITVNEAKLKKAFRSYRELDKLIAGIMNSLTSSDEIDDFALTMKLLENYGNVDGKNMYFKVPVEAVTDESSAKGLIKAVRAIIPTLRFPSRKFNAKGVTNYGVAPEDMYLLVDPTTMASVDVDVLARAFNLDKTEFLGHVVEVPGFGDLENTVALLVHKEFFQIYDTLKEMASTGRNALHLTMNYFLHHHGIMAVSPFYPAIQFTTADIDPVSAVEISGPSVVTKNGSLNMFDATVTGGQTGAVIWEILGQPQYASLNQNGNLVIGPKFADNKVTIRATSVLDDSKYDEIEVVVRGEGDPRAIAISGNDEVTLDDTDDVTSTYTAVVTGDSTNSVAWSLDDEYDDISINESTGVLTAKATAIPGTIGVVATSTKLTSLKAVMEVEIKAAA